MTTPTVFELMYDGVSQDAQPIHQMFPNAKRVAGYANGIFEWSEGQWALFPNAKHLVISVRAPHNYGDVLDVEAGDAAPSETEGWIAMRKQAGLVIPVIYCSRDTLPAVRSGTGRFIAGIDYDIWCAHFTGIEHQVFSSVALNNVPVRPYRCAATQYANHVDFDVSAVYDLRMPRRCG